MEIACINWYMIHTRPNTEKKIIEQLRRKKIESYLPLIDSQEIKRSFWKKKETLLLPGFIFIRINETELPLVSVLRGVISFVYWRLRPAMIRNEEIEAFKNILESFKLVTMEKTKLVPGGEITIEKIPAIHRFANLMEVRPNIIKVNLPSLGYALVARAENSDSFIRNSSSTLVNT